MNWEVIGQEIENANIKVVGVGGAGGNAVKHMIENNIELNLYNLILDKNDFLFHAGTKSINGKTYSNGGRVLNIVIRSNDFKSARDKALSLLTSLDWKSGFYRKDIGHKVIDQ